MNIKYVKLGAIFLSVVLVGCVSTPVEQVEEKPVTNPVARADFYDTVVAKDGLALVLFNGQGGETGLGALFYRLAQRDHEIMNFYVFDSVEEAVPNEPYYKVGGEETVNFYRDGQLIDQIVGMPEYERRQNFSDDFALWLDHTVYGGGQAKIRYYFNGDTRLDIQSY